MKIRTLLFASALFVTVGAAAPLDSYHFGLSKSTPAADAVVESPEAVRLWFTQVPQDNSVSIRLINAAGDALETGEPIPDAQDGKVVGIAISEALAAGRYTVSWRGIGDDGHVVRGDFGFSVTAQ
jgi:methionine-rich copper-binding protein CopC